MLRWNNDDDDVDNVPFIMAQPAFHMKPSFAHIPYIYLIYLSSYREQREIRLHSQ